MRKYITEALKLWQEQSGNHQHHSTNKCCSLYHVQLRLQRWITVWKNRQRFQSSVLQVVRNIMSHDSRILYFSIRISMEQNLHARDKARANGHKSTLLVVKSEREQLVVFLIVKLMSLWGGISVKFEWEWTLCGLTTHMQADVVGHRKESELTTWSEIENKG